MKIQDIVNKVVKFFRADRTIPLMVVGSPGLGKSQAIAQARDALAAELGEEVGLVDVRASLHDPTDFVGFPTIEEGRLRFAQPAFLPREETHPRHGLLFLDEIGQATPAVQAALLQLCLDRRVGEYRLPDGWMIVAASNRREDRAGANRLISPLLDRFAYYEVEADLASWQDWAAGAGIDPLVRAFLRWKPECFSTFDPAGRETVFATPRSWAMVSRILPALDSTDRLSTVEGLVGHGPAVEFEAFALHAAELPAIEAVIADPSGLPLPSNANLSVYHALVGSLAKEVGARDLRDEQQAREVDAIVEYALRLPREFQVLAMRDFYRANEAVMALDRAGEWFTVNEQLMGGVVAHNRTR